MEEGTRLGPYEILSPLGAGGMGEVYLAKDTKLHREVAIKVLPTDVASNPERLQRFEREATTVAALNHPNIVTIHAIAESDGHRYIAMELVEGDTLDRMIAPGGMPLAKIFDIAIPLADALAAAHDKGIVHRDLKPANVMVTTEGRVKVLDFGLAKLVGDDVGGSSHHDMTMSVPLTGQGAILGTVPYMSPEQLQGEALDHRTDLFSLGVMLYEMATAQRPFTGQNSATITSSILRDTPRSVQELNGVLPRHLGRIIEQCLEKDSEHRYQSAKDIRNGLRALQKEVDSGGDVFESQFVSGATPVAQPPSSESTSALSGSALSAPARRGELWIGVGVLAAVIVFVGWWIGRSGSVSPETASIHTPSRSADSSAMHASEVRPHVETTLAILPFENISTDPDTEYLSNEIPADLIDKLSGLSSLSVISRSGAFRFDPAKEDASSFGESLGASVVLTGQLNARGTSLTIRIELVDVATNRQLWSKRYPRELSDIMAVEEDITQNISEALRLQLTREERTTLAAGDTENPEAYRAYIEARFWWSRRSEAGFDRAIKLFDYAISLDPNYARAYAGKADCYILLAFYYRPSGALIPLAQQATAAALRLDASLAEAYPSLGIATALAEYDWSNSEKAFQRGISLNPRYATLHHWFGIMLLAQGRFDEAVSALTRANEIDPNSLIIRADLAICLYYAGNDGEALAHITATLEMDPEFFPAKRIYAWILIGTGEPERAIAVIKQLYASVGRIPATSHMLGVAYANAGQITEARQELQTLTEFAKHDFVSALTFAAIHASLGEVEEAFRWLDQSYEDRDFWFGFLNIFEALDVMHSDPRYDELLRRMGLEPRSKPVSNSSAPNKKIMLAVLPFGNLSGDPEQEYFSDGMTEEMITRLGRLRPDRLGVIARTSAMRYKQTDKRIEQIGRELGVAYVIEGGVRRAGSSVRISAQLIQVSDQTQLWGDSYTRDLSDVFAIQTEVADAVAESLAVELLPHEESGQAKSPTDSSAAYDAYLLGRSYWAKRTPESLYTAIDHFKRAIELDPNYALAYSGLADTWSVLPWYVPGPFNEMNAEAKKAAGMALALDDSVAESHVSMAYVLARQGDRGTAIEHYRKAIEIDPNNATAHQWYGQLLSYQGRFDEAAMESESAITLDPLAAVMRLDYGGSMRLARRWDVATEQLTQALDLQPNLGSTGAELTLAYLGKEDHARAADAFVGTLTSLGQSPSRIARFRQTYETIGMTGALVEWLELFHGEDSLPHGAATHAEFLAWCGEKDLAFKWLERAVQQQDPYVQAVETSHAYDSLRDDPRYADIVKRIRARAKNVDAQSKP